MDTATDDGRRYLLAGPDGVSQVHGSAGLARQLAEAGRVGDCVAFRRIDAATAPAAGDLLAAMRRTAVKELAAGAATAEVEGNREMAAELRQQAKALREEASASPSNCDDADGW